jgi:hypothetical protein
MFYKQEEQDEAEVHTSLQFWQNLPRETYFLVEMIDLIPLFLSVRNYQMDRRLCAAPSQEMMMMMRIK